MVGSSSSTVAADFEERTYAKVSWRLIPFVFLCYILAYLDRVNVGFAKLQMLADLKFDNAIYAAGAGIFFLGYFLFEVPSNILLRRIGARIWIARIMITWGILSSAMMLLGSESFSRLGFRRDWAFYGLRFLLGLAEAGFFPGIIYYLTCWYPSRLRARKTAWFMTAIALAGVIGNPLSGWIIDHFHGLYGLAGWKWLFLIEGLPSVIVGVWVLFYLDSDIDSAGWLSAEEKALLKNNLDAEDRTKSHARLRDAFVAPRVWLCCAIYFFLMMGLYGVGFWIPTIVESLLQTLRGRSAADTSPNYLLVGLVSAIPYGTAAIGMVLLGKSSDRTGERRWHAALTCFAGGIGLILSGVLAHSPYIAIACLSLGTLGILGAAPLFWTMPTAFLAGSAAAAGIGVINSFGNLGGYVGPNISVWTGKLAKDDSLSMPGWLGQIAADPAAALYVIALGLFAAGLLVLGFIPRPGAGKIHRRDAEGAEKRWRGD